MVIFAAEKGRTPCGKTCPYFRDSGQVHCIGGVKKSPCLLIMQPHWLDCNVYDVRTLRTLEMPKEQWEEILSTSDLHPRKVRKPYKKNRKSPEGKL